MKLNEHFKQSMSLLFDIQSVYSGK